LHSACQTKTSTAPNHASYQQTVAASGVHSNFTRGDGVVAPHMTQLRLSVCASPCTLPRYECMCGSVKQRSAENGEIRLCAGHREDSAVG
jgi:hypothetical protein